jgi:hypothetical protein
MEHMVTKKGQSGIIYFATLLFLVIFSNNNMLAQETNSSKKASFGFEAGYQFTTIFDNQAYSKLPKGKSGYNAGLFAEYPVAHLISVRLGLYFDRRGFISQDYLTPIGELQSNDSVYVSYASYYATDLDYSLNYLSIPLSFIYTKRIEKFALSLQVTVYYSLLLSAKKNGTTELYIYPDHAPNFERPEYQVPGSTITRFNNENVMQAFTSNDWGVQLSLGLNYQISPQIGIFLSPGFTIAFQQLYADPLRNSKWNNIYKVNAGIKYTLKQ